MTHQHTPQDAFIAAKFKIDALIERIAETSDHHFLLGPDDITWADVGTLNDIVARLTQITDSMFHEGEYA